MYLFIFLTFVCAGRFCDADFMRDLGSGIFLPYIYILRSGIGASDQAVRGYNYFHNRYVLSFFLRFSPFWNVCDFLVGRDRNF
jgi:hypothetical protein